MRAGVLPALGQRSPLLDLRRGFLLRVQGWLLGIEGSLEQVQGFLAEAAAVGSGPAPQPIEHLVRNVLQGERSHDTIVAPEWWRRRGEAHAFTVSGIGSGASRIVRFLGR